MLSNLRKLSTHITASSNSELTRGTREPSRPTSSDQTKLRYSRKREVSKDTSDSITGIARSGGGQEGAVVDQVNDAEYEARQHVYWTYDGGCWVSFRVHRPK